MNASITIAGRQVGSGAPLYVIAEAGVNHNGDVLLAHALVEAAARAGADAVKFQAFIPEELCAEGAPVAEYASGPWRDQRDMLESLALPPESFPTLAGHARSLGIEFLCTPFDVPSLEHVLAMDVPAVKFSSTDLVNAPLVELAKRSGRPLILSTGASSLDEIAAAIERLGDHPALLFHCVSAYPTPLEFASLATIALLAGRFGRPVGFSDHTQRVDTGGWAVAAGACALEKHLTLDPTLPGPDQRLSLAPLHFAEYVALARAAQRSLGQPRREPLDCESDVRRAARKSVVVKRDIPAGAVLAETDLSLQRPGTGIGPDEWSQVIGKKAKKAIAAGTLIAWEMLE